MAWYDPFNIIEGFTDYAKKPYQEANKEYEKAWGEAKGYEKPYWQHGLDQYGKLEGAENELLDPGALQSKWSSGYETSPYAKQLQGEAKTQGLDAASSMGLLGSSAALKNIETGSTNIMQRDREKYMDDLMRKYMTGIGIGQNIYGTGASTAGTLGNQSMNFGEQMGAGKFNEANAPMNMLMNMIKMYTSSKGGGF